MIVHHQIEKNKCVLWGEMEKLGSRKMSPEAAERLAVYRDAYKALHMLCEEDMKPEGYGGGGMDHKDLTKEDALKWAGRMRNEDGTTGPHWSMEQTEQVRKQRSIDCDPLEFYVTMNMMYSDYCRAAEKVGASSLDFYAYMAKAFLDDKDAAHNKLARYYHCVVGK